MSSSLESIIAPEILGDELYAALASLAQNEEVRKILEIGSSSGRGSTQAFVEGLRTKPDHACLALYAIEVSKQRHSELSQYYAGTSFVHCYHGSSVSADEFPSEEQVEYFYDNIDCGLQRYAKQEVLNWLSQDIRYLNEHGHGETDCISKIKNDHSIDHFDLVLIDGSEFTGIVELNKVLGAKYIALDDTNTYKCFEARKVLIEHPSYEMIKDNQSLRNGYSIFKLSEKQNGYKIASNPNPEIHFFTIVLNGMPFIQRHIKEMIKLPVRWHWHIIEGVAELVNDTAWSLNTGGRILDEFNSNGFSVDGTYEYIDELLRLYPLNITIYRKPPGEFWKGKKEMVAAPLENLPEECLLWQIDADEIWSSEQIMTLWRVFLIDPTKTSAWFWCNYFVGENRYISTRFCYAQNPNQEWLRVWKYRAGDSWQAHEPPQLLRKVGKELHDVGIINPIKHDETEALGLVFDHYAYCTPEQLLFKESYYGYDNALESWRKLQQAPLPCLLADYLPWVEDDTVVDLLRNHGNSQPTITAREDRDGDSNMENKKRPIVIIDCVAWQLVNGGILRLWHDILTDIVRMGYGESFIILDRDNTTPPIPGIRRVTAKKLNLNDPGKDSEMLEGICKKHECSLFLSTYFTTPISTPSYFIGYDMIPESIGADISVGSYLQKQLAIMHSCRQVCISNSSVKNLKKFYPDKKLAPAPYLLHPRLANAYIHKGLNDGSGVKPLKSETYVNPYILYVGERVGLTGRHGGHKNAISLARAVRDLGNELTISIVFAGGGKKIEPDILNELTGCTYYHIQPSDIELRDLYENAFCTVVSSWHEGFGIPIIESQACGCPVICSSESSMGEVAGNGALFVSAPTPSNLGYAIKRLYFGSTLRQKLIRLGRENSSRFDTTASADSLIADIFSQLEHGQVTAPLDEHRGMVRIASMAASSHLSSTAQACHGKASQVVQEKSGAAISTVIYLLKKAKQLISRSYSLVSLSTLGSPRKIKASSNNLPKSFPFKSLGALSSIKIASLRKHITLASSSLSLPESGSTSSATPEFTIITASYNASKTIATCINSVAIQQGVSVEHIIMDNLSSDGTADIVKRYSKCCKFYSGKDSGVYNAINEGISRSKGKYLLFLGADDSLASPFCLSKALRAIRGQEGFDFYYGNLNVINGESRSLYTPPLENLALSEMVFGCLPHQSMIIPKKSFDIHGLYNETFKIHADYEWIIRVLTSTGAKVKKLDLPISNFATGGMSTYRFDEGQAEVLAIQ